jgi:hypothetical protein
MNPRDPNIQQLQLVAQALGHLRVSARVILTPCAEVKVTHLGEYGGFLEAADVDPGASSGDTSHGPTGRRDQGDREASGMLA